MKAEQILKLVEAGFTKEEILAMEAPEKEEASEKTEEESSDELNSDIPEEKPVKKNSSSDSEEKEDEIQVLKDRLTNLEKNFNSRAREEYREDSKPAEDLSLKSIFMSLDEPTKEE